MNAQPQAVFLSYASQDAEAARRICDGLRAAGLEVWFDQSELKGGDTWDASIRRKIRECALFVPVISATTNARSEGYFRLEWKLAVDRSHLMADDQAFLLPVVIDGTAEAAARVPDAFRERQWSRLEDERALAAFAARVVAILAGSQVAGAPATIPVRTPTASPGAGDTPSVAVLPFANRSSDPADEYFSDGLADELLNVLARIRGLRVAARTSSFQFKGKAEDIAVIGRKLNVSTVLEGSVRKSGNRVRISVQLVKVADGYQLWSDTYDRSLDDIFAVQDDIAGAVVQGLREALLGARPSGTATVPASEEVATAARGRSANPEAYRLYLQGRYLVDRMTATDIPRGIECLEAAVAKDPHFAQAHAMLSWAHAYAGGFGLQTPQEANALARAAAERSLALEPDLVEGLVALGTIQMWHDWDWRGAEASFGRARELEPGKPEAARDYGILMWILGRYGEAVTHGRRAIELDPLNPISHLYLCGSLYALGRLEEAEATCRKGIELSPDGFALRYWLAMILDARGRGEEALAEARLDKNAWSRLTCIAALCFRLGKAEESSAALAELKATTADFSAFQIAQAHAARGEIDETFAWLERAFDQRDAGISMTLSCPWFDAVKGDPRWGLFLRKVGLGN